MSDREASTELIAPNLYLAPSRGEALSGRVGRLAQLYGLDVYADSRLSRRAAIGMKAAAIVLTVIFLFDLLAWSLLWNVIFHAGLLAVDLLTLLSLVAGLLFAMATLVYEQQFVTADTSGGWRRIKYAVMLRSFVLIMAALITSQPFELLVFNGSIQERVHEEGVRSEAAKQLSELAIVKEDANLESTEHKLTAQNYQQAKTDEENAVKAREAAKATLANKKGELSNARSVLSAARNGLSRASQKSRAAWAARVAAAQRRVSDLEREVGDDEREVGVQSGLATVAGEKLDAQEGKVEGVYKGAAAGEKRLRRWLTKIQKASPGEIVYEDENLVPAGQQAWVYKDPPYSFFQRLRVLEDLKAGRPAQWREVSGQNRRELINFYKINDNTPDEQEAAETARAAARAEAAAKNQNLADAQVEHAAVLAVKEARVTAARLADDARLFRYTYWVFFFIAMIIPLLVFAMKLLMPQALKDYYSADFQRKSGNYEALVFSKEKDDDFVTVTLESSAAGL